MATTDERLAAAIKRRETLVAQKQRAEGRQEAARKSLAEVEAECRAKGLEPDRLDAAITQMEDRYREAVENLEREVAAAETALAPFLKENP